MKKYIALLLTFFTFCSKKINFFYFLLKIYHQTSNHIFIELKHNRITLFRTNLLKNIIRNLLKSQGISASL